MTLENLWQTKEPLDKDEIQNEIVDDRAKSSEEIRSRKTHRRRFKPFRELKISDVEIEHLNPQSRNLYKRSMLSGPSHGGSKFLTAINKS